MKSEAVGTFARLWMPAALVLLTLARSAVATRIGLHVDEAYYWDWSRHLAASYFDHPPMVAYLIAGATKLFGRNAFAVHLPALSLAFLSSLVLRALVLLLFPRRERLAWASALAINFVPLFAIGAVITTPDAPLVFFWLVSLYLVRLGLDDKPWAWYLAGVAAGLGMLSKYNMALFVPALFAYLASTRQRRWLRRKEPYLALGIALLLFSPVLFWNARHEWVSFHFQLVVRHAGTLNVWSNLRRLLLSQLTVSPLLLPVYVWALFRGYRRGAGEDSHWYLLCCGGAVLAFFVVAGIFTLTLANWPAVGYATVLPLAMEVITESRSRTLRFWPMASAVILSVAFYLQAAFRILPLPPYVDYTLETQEWSQVGERLHELRASMPRPDETFIFAHRFQVAARLAFYAGEDILVTRLGGSRDEYDFWRIPESLRGRDAIYVTEDAGLQFPYEDPFRTCREAGQWSLVRGAARLRTLHLFRCFDYQP